MVRVIFVEKNVVFAVEDLALADAVKPRSADTLVLHEPLALFCVGDSFDSARYSAAYCDMAHPIETRTPENSVFLATPFSNRRGFIDAGVPVNIHPHVRSKYVYAAQDSRGCANLLAAYGAAHGINVPNYELTDKTKNGQRFVDAGFHTLPTICVFCKNDLVSFPYERVILKPAISCGTSGKDYFFGDALYKSATKEDAINALEKFNVFDTDDTLQKFPIVAQKVADGTGDNYNALILSGAVNGAGEIWHFSPIVLDTQFNDTYRNVQSTWAYENNTDETQDLQAKVETFIAGNTNCFYQLQFLRSSGNWVPHDFQFRMTYFVDYGLNATGHHQHKADIIKFTFDQSNAKPVQPAALALDLLGPRGFTEQRRFTSGATRAEAVAARGTA